MVLRKFGFSSFISGSLILILLISSCTINRIRKYQKDKPFVYENNIVLNIEEVTSDEKLIIKSRLNTQLDDSSKVKAVDKYFIVREMIRPPVFDTTYAARSAENMQASMVHLGYYGNTVGYSYKIDSSKKDQRRVTTTYTVTAGKRTLIDTFAYKLQKPDLQLLALASKSGSTLQENRPVTKAAVLGESSRLVDLFRNNGYYKFTAEELQVTGDTTIEALTTISDDPFESLRLLAEANALRNKPTIRLAMTLNTATDSSRLQKYYIGNIYILPDHIPGDVFTDTSLIKRLNRGYNIHFHKNRFRFRMLTGAMAFKKGDLYNQDNFYKTINNFYKLGVWQSPGIDIIERPDSNMLDMVIKLIPVKKRGFEGNLEASYSANTSSTNNISTTNSGNLIGLSTSVSFLARNVGREAIRVTNTIRAGIEFNTSKGSGSRVNSAEIGYSNSLVFPKKLRIFPKSKTRPFLSQQTYINTNLSYIRRIDFFNQQVVNVGFGYSSVLKPNQKFTWRVFNFDFRRLYNQSERFDSTIKANPFLRYSFTTALVMGMGISFTSQHINSKYPNRASTFTFNAEESGTLFGFLKNVSKSDNNFFRKFLKQFVKADAQYTYTISHPKSATVLRGFVGIGIPLSRQDTTLPFFKQYFAGGPNSMRGWPVRGLGVGGQLLAPYGNNTFNDRTGDIQIEGNAEYRYNIAPLFSNVVTLKGAFFLDAGNVWNFKNTKPSGTKDSTQFPLFARRPNDFYKQLAVSVGTGFRFDFSYFLIRFDLGFRIKKPNVAEHAGWQIPNVNFYNLFNSNTEYKRWRYENFNFTIGIDYPF